jgi:predicted MFS family arabinose efflux permease
MLSPGRLMAVQASQREDVRMATALVSFGTSLGQAFGVALGSMYGIFLSKGMCGAGRSRRI